MIQSVPGTPEEAVRRASRLDVLMDPSVFKVLGEPTRVRLLSCLLKCGRPCSVTEVAACCSIDFSMVARHLALMARAGLLSSEKTGRTVWYVAEGAALSEHLRELADAVDEAAPRAACCDGTADSCGPAGAGQERTEV